MWTPRIFCPDLRLESATKMMGVSSSNERPGLLDYLLVLEHGRLDVGLKVWIGALEVGFVGVAEGRAIHAELPGASGDAALSLLLRMSGAHVTLEPWQPVPGEMSSWRDLMEAGQGEASAGRPQRLARARAELAGQGGLRSGVSGREVEAEAPAQVGEEHERASRAVARMFEWAAVESYLVGELDEASELLRRASRLESTGWVSVANLERLRLRLLEAEIEASVQGVEG